MRGGGLLNHEVGSHFGAVGAFYHQGDSVAGLGMLYHIGTSHLETSIGFGVVGATDGGLALVNQELDAGGIATATIRGGMLRVANGAGHSRSVEPRGYAENHRDLHFDLGGVQDALAVGRRGLVVRLGRPAVGVVGRKAVVGLGNLAVSARGGLGVGVVSAAGHEANGGEGDKGEKSAIRGLHCLSPCSCLFCLRSLCSKRSFIVCYQVL